MVTTTVIQLPSLDSAIALVGEQEENLKLFTQQLGAKLVLRGQALHISGTQSQIDRTQTLIQSLVQIWGQGRPLTSIDILTARHALDTQRQGELQDLQKDVIAKTRAGVEIRAKTFRQRRYIQSIRSHALTFCVGPAGTGKTYLADRKSVV